jgi:uncharacterized glyoxalase superfamily protein PhnB
MATRTRKRATARTRGVKKAATKKSTNNKKRTNSKKAAEPSRPQRRQPETLRLRSIMPSLTANDLEASIEFYTDVLGFVMGERWSDDGKLVGAMLKAGSCELGLSQDDWAKGRDRRKGEGIRIFCATVQDIDALAARIQAAGRRLTEEPTTQSWGVRSLSLDDPDGYHWTIYREL